MCLTIEAEAKQQRREHGWKFLENISITIVTELRMVAERGALATYKITNGFKEIGRNSGYVEYLDFGSDFNEANTRNYIL